MSRVNLVPGQIGEAVTKDGRTTLGWVMESRENVCAEERFVPIDDLGYPDVELLADQLVSFTPWAAPETVIITTEEP